MATLNNPITSQNIVDRFADYVLASANSGISWGTNVYPFAEFNGAKFGGTTGGVSADIAAIGNNIGASGTTISAANIYNTLVAETATYTNIRKLRALLFVAGTGGNTGSRPTPGYIYDRTAVAHMNTDYRQAVGLPSGSNLSTGNTITADGLEIFFDGLRSTYNGTRAVNTVTIQVNVCHASCHSSCHSSRGRR
jgi:hypothetical protein